MLALHTVGRQQAGNAQYQRKTAEQHGIQVLPQDHPLDAAPAAKIHLGLQDGTLCTTAGSAVQEAHCQLLPRRQPEQMKRAVLLTGSRINDIPVHKDLILLPCGAEEDGGFVPRRVHGVGELHGVRGTGPAACGRLRAAPVDLFRCGLAHCTGIDGNGHPHEQQRPQNSSELFHIFSIFYTLPAVSLPEASCSVWLV